MIREPLLETYLRKKHEHSKDKALLQSHMGETLDHAMADASEPRRNTASASMQER